MMSRWGSWTWCWYLLIASQDLGNSLPLRWFGIQDRLLLDKIQHFKGGDALAISVVFLSFKHPNWVRDVVLQLYVPNDCDMFELEIFIGYVSISTTAASFYIWICVNQFAHSIEVHSVYFKGVGQSHLARSRPTCWLTLQDIKGVWPNITEIEWQKCGHSDGKVMDSLDFLILSQTSEDVLNFKLCYPLAWLRYIEIRLNLPPLLVFLWGSKVERAFDSSYHEGKTN